MIRLYPNSAAAYSNRGNLKIGLCLQSAIEDYDTAIRLNPNYAAAYSNRAAIKAVSLQHAEALADLDQVVRLMRDHALAYADRAEAKVNLNRIDEARSDFQTALELAEQQNNTALKTDIEKRLQELNNSAPQTDEV